LWSLHLTDGVQLLPAPDAGALGFCEAVDVRWVKEDATARLGQLSTLGMAQFPGRPESMRVFQAFLGRGQSAATGLRSLLSGFGAQRASTK